MLDLVDINSKFLSIPSSSIHFEGETLGRIRISIVWSFLSHVQCYKTEIVKFGSVLNHQIIKVYKGREGNPPAIKMAI
jgi:hypothetical protein